MALFNTFDIATVIGEALKHNSDVQEKDLQPYNDILFKIISSDIESKRDEILDQFKVKIRESPGRVTVVSVPLWTYNTRFFNSTREEYNAELLKLTPSERINTGRANRELFKIHRDNGWHWMVGVSSGNNYEWDDEFTEMTLQENWSLKQVPVDVVVRKTDLLQRLSNLFVDGRVWVTREYLGYVHDDDRCRVDKMALRAYFYVDGFQRRTAQRRALKDVRTKYASYSGFVPQEDHIVTLTGPDLEPPRTPPASPTVSRTPKAPRRTRTLSAESMPPLIHSYDGPDAFRNAARDMLDENADCHCNCCNYDE